MSCEEYSNGARPGYDRDPCMNRVRLVVHH